MNYDLKILFIILLLAAPIYILGYQIHSSSELADEYGKLKIDLFTKSLDLRQCYEGTVVDGDPVEKWFHAPPADADAKERVALLKEQLDQVEFDLQLCKTIKGTINGTYSPESD